ncbi:hypothetical protein [Kitasatospora sp. McL0602]|uniref:hypothetical protein n=1 Tax=Kitasatospora sp. McL0602 TaxID=3439530 RepID=UPI003F888739
MDNDTYPIVAERQLDRLPAARRFRSNPARESGDLLPVSSYQKLVYRIGEEYVVDDGTFTLNDPRVRAATSVTLVDCRKDVPIVVDLKLGSHEAEQFTVRAEFACGVIEAGQVVQDGRQIRTNLLGYLGGCPRIHDIAQQHGIDELLQVRELVQTQIRAYTEIQPPSYPGMVVRVIGTDVLTPSLLRELEYARRVQEREHEEAIARRERALRITRLDQRNSHVVRTDKLDLDQEYDTLARGYAQDNRRSERKEAIDEQLHTHDLQDLDQHGDLGRRRRGNEFAREEAEADYLAIGEDIAGQLRLAHQRGEISSERLFQQLDHLDQRSYGRSNEQRALDREDIRWEAGREDQRRAEERQEKVQEMERQRLHLQIETEERRAAAAQQRDEHRWTVEREDRRAQAHQDAAREARMAELKRRHDDQQRRLEMSFELRRSAIQKGYGDSSIEELERFVGGLENYDRQQDGDGPAAAGAVPAAEERRRELAEAAEPDRLRKQGGPAPVAEEDSGAERDNDVSGDVWRFGG